MNTSFTAQYPGACQECGERFPAGTVVSYDDAGSLVHARCPDDLSAPTAAEPLCPACFCYHAGECL